MMSDSDSSLRSDDCQDGQWETVRERLGVSVSFDVEGRRRLCRRGIKTSTCRSSPETAQTLGERLVE